MSSDSEMDAIELKQFNSDTNNLTGLLVNAQGVGLFGLPAYDNDADAENGGLAAGQLYITTGSASAPLNVAGILMIKG